MIRIQRAPLLFWTWCLSIARYFLLCINIVCLPIFVCVYTIRNRKRLSRIHLVTLERVFIKISFTNLRYQQKPKSYQCSFVFMPYSWFIFVMFSTYIRWLYWVLSRNVLTPTRINRWIQELQTGKYERKALVYIDAFFKMWPFFTGFC